MEKLKDGYKETELGIIPEEWEVKKFAQIFKISAGRDLIKDHFSPICDNEYCFPIYSNSLEKRGLYGYTKIARHKRNSITITGRGTLGKANPRYTDFDAIGRLLVLEPKIDLNCAFISEFINYKVKFFIESTGVPQLTVPQVSKSLIALPPLEEQNQIASILSTVDDLIENTDHLINSYTLLKKGLMQTLLTKGIGHTKFKKTEIGEIPEEWEVKRLSEVSNIIMGQSPESSTYNNLEKGLPFFQGKTEFGEIYPNIVKWWCDKPIKISYPNDILISVRAPVGDVNINNTKACIGRGLSAIRAIDTLLNYKFLFYFLIKGNEEFLKYSQGSTFTAITGNDLRNFKILLPPLQEQNQIASILSSVDDRLELYKSKKEKLNLLKKGLMQQLLTGKIRVKV